MLQLVLLQVIVRYCDPIAVVSSAELTTECVVSLPEQQWELAQIKGTNENVLLSVTD